MLYFTPEGEQSGHGSGYIWPLRKTNQCMSLFLAEVLWKTEVSETVTQSLDSAKGIEYALTGINNDEGVMW